MSQSETIISQAYKHYKNCSGKYDTGHIWNGGSGNLIVMRNIIEERKENAVELISKTDLFNLYSKDDNINNLRREWNKLNGSDYQNLNVAKSALYINRILTLTDKISSILEIGVGLGNINGCIKAKYVGVDIPETLYFAYVNCLQQYPDRKIVWLESEKDLKDYDILFIPVGKENLLNGMKFDLALNTNSFGELSSTLQKFWLNFLETKISIKYFYTLNRFLNVINDDDHFGNFRKNENSFNLSFNNKWAIKSWEVEPDYTLCPYEETRAARCLEILFDCKNTDYSKFDKNILHEDFNDLKTTYSLGSAFFRPMRMDLSKNGTLFKLWNTYRLTKQAEYLEYFKKYLRYLGDSKYKFEEEYYV